MKQYAIGLYPVVDNFDWVAKLLPLGIHHIQLRIKNRSGQIVEDEIQKSIVFAKKYKAMLYINDYWELAIRHGADAVHLGQDALSHANISAIHSAGLRLGISTHNEEELTRALRCDPTYVAFGAIFPTTSKIMSFPPQGIEKLAEWRKKIQCPLVAIGGINLSNIDAVLSTNIDGIALISAITKAPEPIFSTQLLLDRINNYGT